MKFPLALATLLAFFTLSLAWPWPPTLPDFRLGRRDGNSNLIARQNNNDNNGGGSSTAQQSSAASTTVVTSSGDSSSTTQSGQSSGTASSGSGSATPPPKSTAQASQTGSGDSSTNSTQTASTTSLSSIVGNVNGGINMITPATTLVATQYYSVGTNVTWAWNYTSLARPPKNIDVIASMSGASAQTPLTLTANWTWASTQNFTWDTNAYHSQTPLGNGIYALMVYDADAPGGVSATPSPGHLGVNVDFEFGLYQSEYTALANPYVCATCNAAASLLQPAVWKMALGTTTLLVGSFVWFGAEWGALW